MDFEDVPWRIRRHYTDDWWARQEANARAKEAYYKHFVKPIKKPESKEQTP